MISSKLYKSKKHIKYMGSISGTELKRNGQLICKNKRLALIRWVETKDPRQRKYYFLVILMGKKYTKPTKITKQEAKSFKVQIELNE